MSMEWNTFYEKNSLLTDKESCKPIYDESGTLNAMMCDEKICDEKNTIKKEIQERQKLRWNNNLKSLLENLKSSKEEIKTLNISTLWKDLKEIKERLSVVEKRTTKNFSRSYTSCYLYEVMRNPSIFMDKEKLLELFPIEDRIEYLQDQIKLNVNNFDKEAKEEYYKYLLNILKSINDGSLT